MYANYLYWENFLHFPFTEDGLIPLEIYQRKDPNLSSFETPFQNARGEGQRYSHGGRWFYVWVTFYVVLSPKTHTCSDPCSQFVYFYLLIIFDTHCYCVTLFLVLPNVPWHVKAAFLTNPQNSNQKILSVLWKFRSQDRGSGGMLFLGSQELQSRLGWLLKNANDCVWARSVGTKIKYSTSCLGNNNPYPSNTL